MILVPVVFLAIGLLLGFFVRVPVQQGFSLYLAIACLAGMDTFFGGVRAVLEKKFYSDVFLTGFVFNCLIAFGLSWLGDYIGVNVFLVCAFIFGTRIFNNLSLIRRYWLSQIQEARERKTSLQ